MYVATGDGVVAHAAAGVLLFVVWLGAGWSGAAHTRGSCCGYYRSRFTKLWIPDIQSHVKDISSAAHPSSHNTPSSFHTIWHQSTLTHTPQNSRADPAKTCLYLRVAPLLIFIASSSHLLLAPTRDFGLCLYPPFRYVSSPSYSISISWPLFSGSSNRSSHRFNCARLFFAPAVYERIIRILRIGSACLSYVPTTCRPLLLSRFSWASDRRFRNVTTGPKLWLLTVVVMTGAWRKTESMYSSQIWRLTPARPQRVMMLREPGLRVDVVSESRTCL